MDPPQDFMSGQTNAKPQGNRRPNQRRTQGAQHRNQQKQPPQPQQNYGYQGTTSTQLFDDTSGFTQPPNSSYQPGYSTPQPTPQMFTPNAHYQQQPQQTQPAQPAQQQGFFNPQQVMGDPMVANMAMQYGESLANTGREFVDAKIDRFLSVSKLKYYFAVDTNYVFKKLGLLMFPFAHQNWSIKYDNSEPVAPRFEINAPDLYIPAMSFVTYVLVCGLVMGTQNRFSPELLGMTASTAMAWLIFELLVILVTLYVFGIASYVRNLDLLAFCGYKYYGMILCALSGLLFGSTGYYAILAWMSFTTAFFVARNLRLVILPSAASDGMAKASKRRLYLLLSISLMQPLFMYILTRQINQFDAAPQYDLNH